jgi:hypothetical protein
MRRLRRPGFLAALVAAIVAAGCGGDSETISSEPFQPQASLSAVGGTVRGDKPAFLIRVDARPGDSNIRSVEVILPPVVLVDAAAIGRLCSRSELASDRCAGRQRFGFARAVSPAYGTPLSGPVYAVSGFGGRLPHLAYVLGGPANFLLEGRVISEGGRIGAGVDDVPDTPLKTFELRIDGGKRAYLVLSRNICGAAAAADGTFTSQDGQVHEQKIPLMADCGA